jgi:hypothetical protein
VLRLGVTTAGGSIALIGVAPDVRLSLRVIVPVGALAFTGLTPLVRLPTITLTDATVSNIDIDSVDLCVTTDTVPGTLYLYVGTSPTPPTVATIISGVGAEYHELVA